MKQAKWVIIGLVVLNVLTIWSCNNQMSGNTAIPFSAYNFLGGNIKSTINSAISETVRGTYNQQNFVYSLDMSYLYWSVGTIDIKVIEILKALELSGKTAYGVISINGKDVGTLKIDAAKLNFAIDKGYFPQGKYYLGKCPRKIEGDN